MLFTFRPNGENNGQRLVEATVEPVEQHEAPAGSGKHSWFGAEEKLAAVLQKIDFPELDVEGVLAALYTNRVATREVEVSPEKLAAEGFAAAK